jgi:hypothetical protein
MQASYQYCDKYWQGYLKIFHKASFRITLIVVYLSFRNAYNTKGTRGTLK